MVQIFADDTTLKSWIDYDADCEFPIQNIPFGAFLNPRVNEVHCCTRIGDKVIDLAVLEHERLLSEGAIMENIPIHVFCEPTLNKFMELGPEARQEVRRAIIGLFVLGSDKISE